MPANGGAVALVVALVWLPYASTRCLERIGPHGDEGAENCVFGHYAGDASGPHRHEDAATRVHNGADAAAQEHSHKGPDHSADTCCTWTGKFAVTLTAAPTAPDCAGTVALSAMPGVLWAGTAYADYVRRAVPLAHGPPIFIRNAALLI